MIHISKKNFLFPVVLFLSLSLMSCGSDNTQTPIDDSTPDISQEEALDTKDEIIEDTTDQESLTDEIVDTENSTDSIPDDTTGDLSPTLILQNGDFSVKVIMHFPENWANRYSYSSSPYDEEDESWYRFMYEPLGEREDLLFSIYLETEQEFEEYGMRHKEIWRQDGYVVSHNFNMDILISEEPDLSLFQEMWDQIFDIMEQAEIQVL